MGCLSAPPAAVSSAAPSPAASRTFRGRPRFLPLPACFGCTGLAGPGAPACRGRPGDLGGALGSAIAQEGSALGAPVAGSYLYI